ncbi:MAG TPA: HEAT repeat domain-containing protein [Bryobacteraceae bacterium]|nr:HEAT repeat domain-containing protein [Bryobacteraceae bacterium]
MDRRFLHALLDRPERALPDLVRFAAEDHSESPVDLDLVLLDIFRSLRTPESLPFLVELVRRDPGNVDDELIEAFVALGAPAVDPLLDLLNELGDEPLGDVLFLLASLHVRDARILDALIRRVGQEPWDGALALEIYGDPAALPALQAARAKILPGDSRTEGYIESAIAFLSMDREDIGEAAREPYDIWSQYPEESSPEFESLGEDEMLGMLGHPSAQVRAEAAAGFHEEIPPKIRTRLLELAKQDPDMRVRRASWEALSDLTGEPEVKRAMLAVIADADASLEEKSGATIALAQQPDDPEVYESIEKLYRDPASRAAALKAMARSMDRRFAAYPPKHLDDPDPEIQNQAIWAVGYLGLASESGRLELFFKDPKHRTSALFAYALAVPGETSRAHVQALLKKIERVAGELDSDEEELVRIALDQRLMLRGHKPVFFADDSDEVEEAPAPAAPPALALKAGRNDPCPCGSGKKYKKCCGS